MGTTEIGVIKYRSDIDAAFMVWQEKRGARFAEVAGPPLTFEQPLFEEWIAQLDDTEMLDRAGGWWSAVDKNGFFLWLPLGGLALAFGVLWSVLMTNPRRLGRTAWTLLVAVIMLLYALPVLWHWATNEINHSWELAHHDLAPGLLILSICFAGCCVAIGLHYGRSVLRGALTLVVPVRLRSACAVLWVVDGLAPPRT
jgi:hypothetical protein